MRCSVFLFAQPGADVSAMYCFHVHKTLNRSPCWASQTHQQILLLSSSIAHLHLSSSIFKKFKEEANSERKALEGSQKRCLSEDAKRFPKTLLFPCSTSSLSTLSATFDSRLYHSLFYFIYFLLQS